MAGCEGIMARLGTVVARPCAPRTTSERPPQATRTRPSHVVGAVARRRGSHTLVARIVPSTHVGSSLGQPFRSWTTAAAEPAARSAPASDRRRKMRAGRYTIGSAIRRTLAIGSRCAQVGANDVRTDVSNDRPH